VSFFALRPGRKVDDHRKKGSRFGDQPLRAARELPLRSAETDSEELYYYEAQTSILVTGLDEYFWTVYCVVETYYGSEENEWTYLTEQDPLDPPTGGAKWLKWPHWNPREYYLRIVSQRIGQATEEWKSLIEAFDERMMAYVRNVIQREVTLLINSKEHKNLYNFTDDLGMNRTKELIMTVDTIRRFRDVLAKSIAAWNSFQLNGISCFELQDRSRLQLDWGELLAVIRGSVTEMQSMHLHLTQKLERFQSMHSAVSQLKYSTTL